jgi:polysaccharide export outer membrane protein
MMKKCVVLLLITTFVFANNVPILLFNSICTQIRDEEAIQSSKIHDEETVESSEVSDEDIELPEIEEIKEVESKVLDQEDIIYYIEPGDLLEIVVLGEEELSRTLMVMHNGTISFPLIGEVMVTGLTTEEATALLEAKLKKYFTHPVISIVLKSPTLPYVSVFGEVLRPGAVEYQRGLRVTDYIALAGGPTPAANLGKVNVVRFLTGEPVVEIVNVNEILKQGLIEGNYPLKSGDWVFVSKKFVVNWGLVVQTLTFVVAVANLYITVQNINE